MEMICIGNMISITLVTYISISWILFIKLFFKHTGSQENNMASTHVPNIQLYKSVLFCHFLLRDLLKK